MTVDSPAKEIEIRLRRYRCQACRFTMSVGPAGVLTRRLFTAMTIGLALALWSGGDSGAAVRREVSPWQVVGPTAQARWNALRRWAVAASAGELWPSIRLMVDWTRREIAKRVSAILMSRGPPSGCNKTRVFEGAAQIR